MPVWYISRRDGQAINGFVCGLGGAGVAKRSFRTLNAAERGQKLIASRDQKGFENDEYVLEEVRSITDHLTLDADCVPLVAGIKAEPFCETRQRVLADRLHELGIEYKRAYRKAHEIALDSMNPCLWPTADVEKLLKGTRGAAYIRRKLDLANGKRKVRTVNMAQAMEACQKARKSLKVKGSWMGWHVAGGTSHRRNAITTVFVVAVSDSGRMRVAIGTIPAAGWGDACYHLGVPNLSDSTIRNYWVGNDEVAVWSVGVGAANVTRLC